MRDRHAHPRILVIYFSLSGQSRGLINLLAAGMRHGGSHVVIERLRTIRKITFPFNGILPTLWMMLTTFFRLRMPISEPAPTCFDPYDLIVLAGPTWSYNPSGPVLFLIDRYGRRLFAGQTVLPLLSCRGYYRMHNKILRKRLQQCGAHLEQSLIFSHPVKEPWSTIGVFLKSAGYHPQRLPLLRKHYPHFGHTAQQLHQIKDEGNRIALKLRDEAVRHAQSSVHEQGRTVFPPG